MRLTCQQAFTFSCIGQRTVNQDSLYPEPEQTASHNRLFLVCDGMGGADKGEVASHLLCRAIVTYYHSSNTPTLNAVHLEAALGRAYDDYLTYLGQHPLVNRMGSTLALLQLNGNTALVAHIGDSRVYHIRNGEVLFQTRDHKQVNELVEEGIISAEQALTHPWRNRLSRAVLGQNGTETVRGVLPDLHTITDLRAGDYFFLCSDGTLEQVTNYALAEILSGDLPDATKLQTLLGLCQGRTKDNYSGHLIAVQAVDHALSEMTHAFSGTATL